MKKDPNLETEIVHSSKSYIPNELYGDLVREKLVRSISTGVQQPFRNHAGTRKISFEDFELEWMFQLIE